MDIGLIWMYLIFVFNSKTYYLIQNILNSNIQFDNIRIDVKNIRY